MIKKNISPRLEKFLRKNSVYTRFVRNVYKLTTTVGREKFTIHTLSEAFHWQSSPEKGKFWADLNDKFEGYETKN